MDVSGSRQYLHVNQDMFLHSRDHSVQIPWTKLPDFGPLMFLYQGLAVFQKNAPLGVYDWNITGPLGQNQKTHPIWKKYQQNTANTGSSLHINMCCF